MTEPPALPPTDLSRDESEVRAALHFMGGHLDGRELPCDGETTIGRRPDCGIVLPASATKASTVHARIIVTVGGARFVEDCSSGNGTLVNGRRLARDARELLTPGDVLQFGDGGPTAKFVLVTRERQAHTVPTQGYAITLARVVDGETERMVFENRPIVTIGREPSSHVRFDPHRDASVSKDHARIRFDGRTFQIDDTGSGNGTFVNGETVKSVALRRGDVIELGTRGPKVVVEAITVPDGGPDVAEVLDVVERVEASARRRTGGVWLALGVLLIAALIGGWWLARRRVDSGPAAAPPEVALSDEIRFRELHAQHGAAIFLVHAAYTLSTPDGPLEVPGIGDQLPRRCSGETFGTAFIVNRDGAALTCRHVVQPWLYDDECMEQVAAAKLIHGADAIRITHEVNAWQSDTAFRDAQGVLNRDAGYSTGAGNLRILGSPPDQHPPAENGEPAPERHVSGPSDLAVVLLVGAELEEPQVLRLRDPASQPEVLEPVMGIGFPAGKNLLEGEKAVSSPTIGTIRKVEDRIQTDLAILPGNSGGPVIDREGRVIGVTYFEFENEVGIAIPTRYLVLLARKLGVALPP